jgi:1-acyl-sn-glycerol-3-phosphate acyltransferase
VTQTWQSQDYPAALKLGVRDKLRAAWRGSVLGVALCLGIIATLCIRLIEIPLFRSNRPWSGWITVFVCRAALRLLSIKLCQDGAPTAQPALVVANHSSWLDIFALNAGGPLYFVSKSEVARWPGIGLLARLTGTVFVRREKREAGRQKTALEQRLGAGHRLLFFPEGTSTDNRQVLPFKPTLFAAVFSPTLYNEMYVQPVSVVYKAPDELDDRFLAWWGDMELAPHLLRVLANCGTAQVHVIWHPPIKASDYSDRKSLARTAEKIVQGGHARKIKPSRQ